MPYISDLPEQIEEMIATAKDYNAKYVFVGALTLSEKGKELYYRILERDFPELISKYEKLFKYASPMRSYQDRLEKIAKELYMKYELNMGYSTRMD